MSNKIRGLTKYQFELLTAVRDSQAKGYDADLDQLLECLSWEPTKASIQFSIRALMKKDLLAKTGFQTRRGRKRICFQLGKEGAAIFDPRGAAPAAPKTASVPGIAPDRDVFEGMDALALFDSQETLAL